MSKPKVIKDFDKLEDSIQERIRLNYPDGFEKHLVKFVNAEGKNVSALPFETEDRYYLVRMTLKEARELSNEVEDFDPDAIAAEIKDEFVEKYDSGESDDEKDGYEDDDDSDSDEYDDDDDDGSKDDY
jgi:hypothetical protein